MVEDEAWMKLNKTCTFMKKYMLTMFAKFKIFIIDGRFGE